MYILVDGKPVPEPDMEKWGLWMRDDANRRVAWDDVGDRSVSTVFLGTNHAFCGGPPILFETMVREADGNFDDQWRYCTLEEAKAGHSRVMDMLRAKLSTQRS